MQSLVKIAEQEAYGKVDKRWRLIDVAYDMRLFRKASQSNEGKNMYSYRAMTIIDCSPQDCANVIMNWSNGKRWIPYLRDARLVRTIDDNTDVVYLGRMRRRLSDLWSTRRTPAQISSTVVALFLVIGGLMEMLGGRFGSGAGMLLLGVVFLITSSDKLSIWPRDLLLRREKITLGENTVVIGLRSVSDDTVPERSSWVIVRGNVEGGGFIIQALKNGKSRLSLISQADFRGWSGIYGAYSMHVEHLSLLISLKNYIHSEITPVADMATGFEQFEKMEVFAPSENSDFSKNNNNNNNNNNNMLTSNTIVDSPDVFNSDLVGPVKRSTSERVVEGRSGSPFSSSGTGVFMSDIPRDKSNALAEKPSESALFLRSTKKSSFAFRYDMPSPTKYKDVARKNREMALKIADEDEEDGWTFVSSSKGVKVFQKRMDEGPNFVRGFYEDMPCTASEAVTFVCDISTKGSWDPMFKEGHVVERIDDFTSVLYERFHPIFPVSGRDFCVLYSLQRKHDGTFVRSAVSVEHGHCPEVSGVVRGEIIFGSFVASPNKSNPKHCDCTFTVQVDLKGNIPAWIVARVATDQPMVLATFHENIVSAKEQDSLESGDKLEGFFENVKVNEGPPEASAPIPLESSQRSVSDYLSVVAETSEEQQTRTWAEEEDDEKNSLSNVTLASTAAKEKENSIPVQKTTPKSTPKSTPTKTPSPSTEATSTKPTPAASSSSTHIKIRSIPSSEKAVSTPSPSSPLGETELSKMFSTVKQAEYTKKLQEKMMKTFKSLLDAASEDDQSWTSMGIEYDVVLMQKKASGDSSISSFKGYGPIDADPDKIEALVSSLAAQSQFDPLFHFGMIVERFTENVDLRYVVYQTQQCLIKTSRNFVYMLGKKRLPDGTIIIAATSADRPDLPVAKGSVRGTIDASGWVIQPFPNSTSCMCTYISTVDLGGLPSAVVNIVSRKQPLLIANVRKIATGSKQVINK